MPHMKLLHATAAHTGSVIYHNSAINHIPQIKKYTTDNVSTPIYPTGVSVMYDIGC